MPVEFPKHSRDGEYFIFPVEKDEATIIFKCELALKEVLKSVAKNDGKLGNTITSVITHLLVKGLEEEFNYKFHLSIKT